MKKILFASLLLTALASCKKEDPVPPPNGNPAPTVHENYVILNGDGHTNDTIRFTQNLLGNVHGDTLDIMSQDSAQSTVGFWGLNAAVGTSSLNTGTSGMINVASIGYVVSSVSITITSLGSPGGYITGTYSGNFQRGNPPYTPITVTGKFSVIRN